MESYKAWLTWWSYALMLLIHPKHRLTVWEWFTKAGKGLTAVNCWIKGHPMVVAYLPDSVLYMSNDSIPGWLKKVHHSGRILLLAPSFLIVPLTRKLKLLLGFIARCYSKGNMQSLQEQHITQSEIVKLIYVLYRKAFQETTHCQGEYVSTVFICPKKDSIYMLIRSKKP